MRVEGERRILRFEARRLKDVPLRHFLDCTLFGNKWVWYEYEDERKRDKEVER